VNDCILYEKTVSGSFEASQKTGGVDFKRRTCPASLVL
jgi:hypothetical protein